MAEHNRTGMAGEEKARHHLIDEGYRIIESNWRWHHYELDIVAETDQTIVIVEVKTRAEDYLMSPEEAVNESKIRRIVNAADAYLQIHAIDKPVRFDIISVVLLHDGQARIDHMADAFLPPVYKGKHW